MHDDCSVFVNEKGLNVVSISSVETFGGQGETFRAAVELYPHCVYQKAPTTYAVDFLVGESQKDWLYGEEEVALFWGEQLGVAIEARPHLEEEYYIVISGRTQEAVRQAFTTLLLRWRCTLFEIPTLIDFKTIGILSTFHLDHHHHHHQHQHQHQRHRHPHHHFFIIFL